MNWIPAALCVWLSGGLAALALKRRPELSAWTSAMTLCLGTLMMLPALWNGLAGSPAAELRLQWNVPAGEFALRIDALTAWFLLPTLALSVLAAIYGVGYLSRDAGHRPAASSWFFFNVLVASMAVVLTASNAVLFLTAWEVMALASFFLVTFHDERESVRRAGWIYLVATHLGTAFLLALFILLGRETGTLDFGAWAQAGISDPRLANVLFLLALVGFGAKAGIMPFHVWLPEAHPAAPSHVSAVMSGVMIKTGIYGLLRALSFFGEPPAWWGWLLIILGLVSGVLGVLFALAQHDLKRLLAYHSVENIGIIVLGLGLGELGLSLRLPWLAVLGFGGCLLHVLNHALFKGLLFLAAGSVISAARSGNMDRLGGLLRRMPLTSGAFLVGAVAISGLPPLNGFISEMLIFTAAFEAIARGEVSAVLAGAGVVAGLALISGLAVACFTKAFGSVFLGLPRGGAGEVKESERTMVVPMLILAASCLAIGLGAPWIVRPLFPVIAIAGRLRQSQVQEALGEWPGFLGGVALGFGCLIILCTLLALLRKRLLRGKQIQVSVTWDCGYAQPTARMQYSASSFAQPVTHVFEGVLKTETLVSMPESFFPASASFSSHTPDPALERCYKPVFTRIARLVAKLRWLQHGNIHLYVLYIALTLVLLLVWMMD